MKTPRPPHRHPVNQVMHDQASRTQRAVDRFVVFFGSLKFIAWMTAMIAVWIAFNTLTLTGAIHFDKYPFILLNLLFSTQASYAAPLILLSQNRAAERDRLKAEHDYEINADSYALTQQLAVVLNDNTALTQEVRDLVKANKALTEQLAGPRRSD